MNLLRFLPVLLLNTDPNPGGTPGAKPAPPLRKDLTLEPDPNPALAPPVICYWNRDAEGKPLAADVQLCPNCPTYRFKTVPARLYCTDHAEQMPRITELRPDLDPVLAAKINRQRLDAILQDLKQQNRKSRNNCLAINHVEDAIMRLGMDLKDMKAEGLTSEPSPYPEGYKENKVVEKTADGLKM